MTGRNAARDQVGEAKRLRNVAVEVTSTSHVWAKRRSTTQSALEGVPLIREKRGHRRRRRSIACREVNVNPAYTIQTSGREALREAIGHNLGIGVIARVKSASTSAFTRSGSEASTRCSMSPSHVSPHVEKCR